MLNRVADFRIWLAYGVMINTAQMKELEANGTEEKMWSSLNHVDYKLVIIPIVFVFLRIWSEIVIILYIYVKIGFKTLPTEVNLALFYLAVS